MAPKFVEGAPYWVDLSATDVSASVEFYSRLFGWEATDTGPDSGHYTWLSHEGDLVAAIGSSFIPEPTPQWMLYFKTEALWDRTKAIEAAGGLVRMPPADVFDQTSIAQFTDPAGAPFAVSQPGTHTGAQKWGEPGSVCWVELHVRQPEPSMSFYQRVFGWGMRMMSDTNYPLLTTDDQSDFFGGLEVDEYTSTPPHWSVYFGVPDCDATAERAVALGGRILSEPHSIPSIGRWTTLADPAGTRFRAFTGHQPA
ncbi:MAG TPA: VOC family protein [Candidatus Stackebrandtia excrementipullorum]|nr:VOC family protein [Candidatus Stackebrandtia excrementipullorum]